VTYYAVTRERGPNWDPARPMREQDGWDDHAAFMDALAEEGFVVLGGPLGEGDLGVRSCISPSLGHACGVTECKT
jgi:hypothetical protein